MSFLLDTNVVSELRKESKCSRSVWEWYAGLSEDETFISVLTLGELRRGIELRRLKDAAASQTLERWFQDLKNRHENRIFPITTAICDLWGRLSLRQQLPEIDGLLAATAMHHGLTLVTRNTADIRRSGVDYFNPFAG
jgi:predicted nucleic acid-binding protein